MTNILKAPLLHFALLGALLFVLYAWLNPNSMERDDQLIISKGEIQHVVNIYENKWKRKPTEKVLKSLLDDYVLTQIYYLEGIKLGFDKNDNQIKRRVRQKMEMVSSNIFSALDVKDEALQTYLDEHPQKYAKDTVYSFRQIYVDKNKHRDDLKTYLEIVRKQLRESDVALSDPIMMQEHYDNVSSFSVNRELGKDFAKQLDGLVVGQWSEVLKSGLGLHFVKLEKKVVSKKPTLDEVRDAVLKDYLHEKRKDMMEKQNQQMLKMYDVVIETNSTTPKADI